ncbi:MAG: SPOR domain-containing protein [Bordetella sp.]|nr:MAG: SPOR domain-containing protein [Bordetella sp.]
MKLFNRNRFETKFQDSNSKRNHSILIGNNFDNPRIKARRKLIGMFIIIIFTISILPKIFDAEVSKIGKDININIKEKNFKEKLKINLNKPDNVLQKKINDSKSTHIEDNIEIGLVEQKSNKISVLNKNIEKQRSDDGKRALALLEGRIIFEEKNTINPNNRGKFILQIATYDYEEEAQLCFDKLFHIGINEIFIAKDNFYGQVQFHVRAGPFSSQDLANNVNSQLKILGYNNNLIIK